MSESVELNEDEMVEAIADALTKDGFSAFAQDTGGGMLCVVMERTDGGEIAWGTADVNWGATVTDADGEIIGSIETSCPSDSQNLEEITSAMKEPSISNGAAIEKAV